MSFLSAGTGLNVRRVSASVSVSASASVSASVSVSASASASTTGVLLARRGKVNLASLPPWRRLPKTGVQTVKPWKLPEVEPPIDIFSCKDPSLVADAVSEVVPWKRRWEHHAWLHRVCAHVHRLLPQMAVRDVVRVTLAFGELYPKRKPHTMLFYNYETYVSLFQALPVTSATAKTLLPLLRAYRRMDVSHEPFVRAACDRVVSGEVELEPKDLAELVRLHSQLKIKAPNLFEFVVEVLDLRFPFFSEDEVGDLARAFCTMRYHSKLFFEVLHRELPYRLHEYAWWNLIDIAELYLELKVQDPEVVQRIGNETFKLVFSMKSVYTAKALRVLAHLEVGDKRTFRLLIRTLPRRIHILSPQIAAESVLACAMVKVDPQEFYHKLPGSRIYINLLTQVIRDAGALSAKMTCDLLASLAHVGHRQTEFLHAVEAVVAARPFKFHAEHLASLLRDFASLRHKSPGLRSLLVQRAGDLPGCTPSGLCALPLALAGHPRQRQQGTGTAAGVGVPATGTGAGAGVGIGAAPTEEELELLGEASRLLCAPGVYQLPSHPRSFRSKDDFWWQKLQQSHFRHRRRKAAAGTSVKLKANVNVKSHTNINSNSNNSSNTNKNNNNNNTSSNNSVEAEEEESAAAVAHISIQECVQLMSGCAQLQWRDEQLLAGVTAWLCSGTRHSHMSPEDVATLLHAFATLQYSEGLLRAALEHALLRTAPRMPAKSCPQTLRSALDLGMGPRSAAVRALVRRCTAELAMIPPGESEALWELHWTLRHAAQEELLAELERRPNASPSAALRMPLELHLFSEAVQSRLPAPSTVVVPREIPRVGLTL